MIEPQFVTIYENEFYEHLTELIQVFKRIIFAIEDASSIMKLDGDYELNIHQIKKIMQEEDELIQKYNFSLEAYKTYHSAYHRFICRLVENLTPCKTKISKDEQKILIVEEYLLKLENCINFHRKERNLARMFKRIFVYTLKFCQACEMLLSCCSQNEAIDVIRKEVQQQRQTREPQSKPISKLPPQYQSQSNFHKVIVVFNKRFATMSCLDLDYNSFKSYCYMSRNDTDDQLYKDFINRNTIVSRAITRYSRSFSDFLKRKQKNLMRKNRFRELKATLKTNQISEEPEKHYYQHTIEEHLKSNMQAEQKTEESPLTSFPFLREEQKRIIMEPQLKKDDSRREEAMRTRRGNYEMKNVYLTINKFHDKFETMNSNRFMLNYSLPKTQEPTRKFSIKAKDSSLKSTRIIKESISPTLLMHHENEVNDSFAFEQMVYQTKMALSPRVSIIHKCHIDKKGDKRNIRITNLTFRGPNYSKLSSLIDPENIEIV